MNGAQPEKLWGDAERRHLRIETVRDYGAHVRAVARRLVPANQVDDAMHVGVLGLFVAADMYVPSRGTFWGFAARFVRSAIQAWCDVEEDPQRLRDLSEFAAALSPEERALLFAEDGQRPNGEVIPFRRP